MNSHRYRAITRHTLVLCALLAVAACSTPGQRPGPAPVALPAAFAETAESGPSVVSSTWWQGFGSAELSRLVDAALAGNPGLQVAAERVRQAEEQVNQAGASLFPTLSASAATSRRDSRTEGQGSGQSSSTSLGLSASYELDLWGRQAAGRTAAQAQWRSTRFDRDAAQLSLASGVATAYFELLSLRGRLQVAQRNLEVAERVQKVVDSRVRNGVASALDRSQQQTAVLQQRAALLPLALQQRQTLYALALLVGGAPQGLEASLAADALLAELTVPVVSPGLPSTLLLRRPDLASVQAQLAAADANITAAQAALLPSLQLSGSAGLSSPVLINLLNTPTAALSLGASLLQPIFDGGRLRSQVAVAESQQRALVASYQQVVWSALADVDQALAAHGRLAQQEVLQAQVLTEARSTLRLAELRYREGVSDLLSVLDAQRTLFSAEDQAAQLRLARLQAVVALYMALGGGWVAPI